MNQTSDGKLETKADFRRSYRQDPQTPPGRLIAELTDSELAIYLAVKLRCKTAERRTSGALF